MNTTPVRFLVVGGQVAVRVPCTREGCTNHLGGEADLLRWAREFPPGELLEGMLGAFGLPDRLTSTVLKFVNPTPEGVVSKLQEAAGEAGADTLTEVEVPMPVNLLCDPCAGELPPMESDHSEED